MTWVGCPPVWYMKLYAESLYPEYKKMYNERKRKEQKCKIQEAINKVYRNVNGTN